MPDLFIIAFKSKSNWFQKPEDPDMPQFAKDALACAQRYSGCNVIALTDIPTPGWDDIEPYAKQVRDIETMLQTAYETSGHKPALEWDSMYRRPGAVFRWLVMRDYVMKHNLKGPFFSIDWDVLVLSSLHEHFTKLGYESRDYSICYDTRTAQPISSAPYVVNNVNCLHIFSDFMYMVAKHGTPGIQHLTVGDMGFWRHLQTWGCFNVGDCGVIADDAVFDKSISLDLDIFVDEDGHNKRVLAVDGIPHFVRRVDGKPIRCISIHCFMSWKTRTHKIMDVLRNKPAGSQWLAR
jgi:hypothetical protein